MKIYRSEAPSYMLFTTILVGVMFLVLFGILPAIDKLKPEKPYSPELKNGSMVYFEIVEIKPHYATSSSNLVCTCKSAEGLDIWMYIEDSDYEDLQDLLAKDVTVTIHGKVRDTDDMSIEDLHKATRSATIVLYLSVSSDS